MTPDDHHQESTHSACKQYTTRSDTDEKPTRFELSTLPNKHTCAITVFWGKNLDQGFVIIFDQ